MEPPTETTTKSLRDRLAYRALIATAPITSPRRLSAWWEHAWETRTMRMTGATTVTVHGYPLQMNCGYAYPAFYRRWPQYTAPLARLVNATASLLDRRVTVVDVGAADGDTAALILERCRRDVHRIVCVEPDAEFYPYLAANFGGRGDIDTHQVMLSDRIGQAATLVRTHSGTASAQGDALRQTTTLDVLLAQRGCDVLKVDTDGFDGRILAGATGLLRACRPTVMFEGHPVAYSATGNDYAQPFRELVRSGYRWFVFFTKEGDFSQVRDGLDQPGVDRLAALCLSGRGPRPDWHYDVAALRDDDHPNPLVVAGTTHPGRETT